MGKGNFPTFLDFGLLPSPTIIDTRFQKKKKETNKTKQKAHCGHLGGIGGSKVKSDT